MGWLFVGGVALSCLSGSARGHGAMLDRGIFLSCLGGSAHRDAESSYPQEFLSCLGGTWDEEFNPGLFSELPGRQRTQPTFIHANVSLSELPGRQRTRG